MTAHKLDIFDVLTHLDRRDFDYYQSLDDEEKKGFVASVTLRWMSGTSSTSTSEISLLILNEVANVNFYDLHQHPELQYKLLTSAGLGSKLKHQWVAIPKAKKKNTNVHIFLSNQYPSSNTLEIDLILSKFSKQTFSDFLYDCGLELKECKELMKTFNEISKVKKS